ncbi:hypothetical protein BJP25_28390 [Actinokineospora bangkokensis]|uniref:Uncharacterized protein n=1 Tax=Actinokineospora bangkokensis TaxID=1193682 RepID=A0A1Q9LGI9_9PSEU|nr:hypothetical protein BJP25_28390 [Actinokineospora bangkokensis]
MAALSPVLTTYAVVAAVLAIGMATAARAVFSTTGVLAAAVPGWLAAHQVPLSLGGRELGVLPLLPTIAAALMVWRTAATAAERLDAHTPKRAAWIVGTIAGAHGVVGLLFAIASSGGSATADPLAALYYPALISALAASAGVLPRAGFGVRERIDELAWRGLKAGLLALAAFLAIGATVFLAALLGSFGTVRDLFAVDGAGSGLGMLLLSLGYLPNAVIAATGFATGPGFALGEVGIGPFGFTGGPVPAFPLLGVLPDHAAPWWFALLLLPAAVGAVVGWTLRDVAVAPAGRLRAVVVAAVVVAMALAVLAGSAGGAFGGGAFNPVDLRAAWVSLAGVLWVAVPGSVVAWTTGERSRPRAEPDLDDDLDDDPDEEQEPENPGDDGETDAEPGADDLDDDPGDEPGDGPEDGPGAGSGR